LQSGVVTPPALFGSNPWLPPRLAEGGAVAWLAASLATVALYFGLGVVVDRFFAAYGLFPAPIWLPASVAVVAAMAGGPRLLPAIFLGSFLTNAVLFAPPLHVSLIISLTNALGPVLGAVLLRRWRPPGGVFTSFAGVVAFLVCATFVAPMVSASGGALAMAIGQPLDPARIYATWIGWWLTDCGGTLYLAPSLILWLGLEREQGEAAVPHGRFGRRDLAVWGAIAAASLLLFLTPTQYGGNVRVAFPFLLAVPLSWVALRMSLRSAYTLVTLVAVAATAGTVAGFGPFHTPGVTNPLQLVGVLVAMLAMDVLTVVALVSERHAAQNANKVKSMFLAQTSHELRTPLNAILGYSQIIDRQSSGAEPRSFADYARMIHASGEHLLALINHLLDVAKIEAGRFELKPEPVRLAAAVEEALGVVDLQARAKSIAFGVDLPAEFTLQVDPQAFRQILLNLLSNAVKFTPDGGRIEIAARRGAAGELALSVADSGVGIPAEALERVFAPFERARRAATRDVEGTGLGLTITRGLVGLHGGTIRLDSAPGHGTVATVVLPAARVIATPAALPRAAAL